MVAFACPEYFGLDFNNYEASQGVAQLEMYVGHCRRQDCTGKLLMIKKEYIELIIGKWKCPLEHPESALVNYVEKTWILTLAWFLHRCQGSVVTKSERVVEKQHDNDNFIMNYTDDFSESARKKIQSCHL